MAKRNRSVTPSTNKRKIAQQRGIGRLGDYKPWNNIQDSASNNLVTRIKGWKTGRIHQILSQLKLHYFYLLEWTPHVIDIREQFPLDQAETEAVARETVNSDLADEIAKGNIICTDFIITVRNVFGTKEIARSVIYSSFLTNKTIIKKLEVERRYWAFRNIDWGIVTENEINITVVKNIEWIHSFLDASSLLPITPKQITEASQIILPKATEQGLTLCEIASFCDEQMKLPTGSALSIIRHLISIRILPVDISTSIQPANILKLCRS